MFITHHTLAGPRQVYIPLIERSFNVGDGVVDYVTRRFTAFDRPLEQWGRFADNLRAYGRRPRVRPEALLAQDRFYQDIPVVNLSTHQQPVSSFGKIDEHGGFAYHPRVHLLVDGTPLPWQGGR